MTDTDALKERINDAFLSEGPWRAAVEAVMSHEGYTEEEIEEAYGPVIHTNECTDHGFPFGYDCTDDEGRDLHPLHTRSQELDNTYRLFFEESDLAAAVLPIVEAEARAAKAEALRDAADGLLENIDWSDGRSSYGDNDGYEASARELRARATEYETGGRA